jgi:hypothetical protein
MTIADRYARRLASGASSPAAVLLVERAGELDVVVLDGEGYDVIPQVRLLLGRSGATSSALLVELPDPSAGITRAGFWILGESLDGAMVRRCYRIRPCGRARRLTALPDGDDPDVEGQFRPLFPVHARAGGTGDNGADEPSAAAPLASTDLAAITGRIVAA